MDPIGEHVVRVTTGAAPLALWFLLAGWLVYAVMAFDRRRHHRRVGRVPETSLLWLSALGGWFGALLALRWYPRVPFSPQFRGWLRGIVAVELICLGLAGLPPGSLDRAIGTAMSVALGEVQVDRTAKASRLMLDSDPRKTATVGNIVSLSAAP